MSAARLSACARRVLCSSRAAAASPGARRGARCSSSAGAAPAAIPTAGTQLDDVSLSFAPGPAPAAALRVLGVHPADLAGAPFSALDAASDGALAELVATGEWKAAPGSALGPARLRAVDGASSSRLLLVGLGEPPADGGAVAPAAWRALGAAAGATARAAKAATLSIGLLSGAELPGASAALAASAALLAAHGDDSRFKSGAAADKPVALAAVRVSADAAASAPDGGAADLARGLSAGAHLARRLVNEPPNVCTPTRLAGAARELADRFPDVLRCAVLDRAECERRGMGLFLGVSAASDEPPAFIHLTYTPPGGPAAGAPVLALVGKGLTFDSGGYNIKAGAGSMIELMKFDMGGAAAVLGAARTLAALRPAGCTVHIISASCENMVGSRGMRPGDILTASNGTSVEINNTDAEGRLTLADALLYAQGPDCGATRVVDAATLTGACIMALGPSIAGLLTPDEPLAAALSSAAAASAERLWRLPLEASYWEPQMSSLVADMKNTGTGKGGAITAGLFLQKFVQKGVAWAHLDIAGPVWSDKDGATGYGAATLARWVLLESAAAVAAAAAAAAPAE